MVAVFDGHGINGHRAANRARELCAEAARSVLAFAAVEGQLPAALRWLFGHVHERFTQEGFCQSSGTTCTAAVIDPNSEEVTVAHVGDSKLIITRRNKIEFVTQDHDIDAEDIERISGAGGEVWELELPDSKFMRRVVIKGTSGPGLAISRALGDVDAHSVGVLWEPAIESKLPFSRGSALVIASDGVWDALPLDVASLHVAASSCAVTAAHALVVDAHGRWPSGDDADDITAVVVKGISFCDPGSEAAHTSGLCRGDGDTGGLG